MATAIVTGSCGLVGSEAVEFLIKRGMEVIGIDNDLRGSIFGKEGSNWARRAYLIEKYGEMGYTHHDADIRNPLAMVNALTLSSRGRAKLIFHTAGQPSHDWSALHPKMDFEVNALGTLNVLEAVRSYCPEAVFVHMSTNKVYGDWVNTLDYEELPTRYTPKWWGGVTGIGEDVPIDQSMHSPFGVSKLAADLMVQEYGRYYGMKTACFRCGCITGQAHAGVSLHGFLAYLAKCVREKQTYTVIGYKGKQVRDNIHAYDVCTAMWEVYQKPKAGIGAVYNLGGGLSNSCSILEAMASLTRKGSLEGAAPDRYINWTYQEQAHKGDHKWWITDTRKFRQDYPNWDITRDLPSIYKELLKGG